ncbi:MAG: hypothetical protein WCW68_09750 [Methanothrix sp.]
MFAANCLYLLRVERLEINSHVVRSESILVQVVSAYLTYAIEGYIVALKGDGIPIPEEHFQVLVAVV